MAAAMMNDVRSIASKLLSILSPRKRPLLPPAALAAQQMQRRPAAAPTLSELAGSAEGWLRVVDAQTLLQYAHADKALHKLWQESRVSAIVWQRDFLPTIHRYAEFVQLMPASEAHHHAHVGGLLSHTMEMLLAAMTWRNGHLLPEGEAIEVIDAQRDAWTYVVFLAALLHDVAKPMTDLRIQWKAHGMSDALLWSPTTGALTRITQGRADAQYRVEFTPKAARDYSAHSRLALLLLPQLVPQSVFTFLSGFPRALDTLNGYLAGQDRESLVAQIVRKADALSAQRALQDGSKARFATATAKPLIDLLMQAMGEMLRGGVTLPLNRSGAAGWVHDGHIWFVAKRLADATREWIRKNEPEQTVPGETKNDRLFDTWQDYGVIERNPHTGQAVWYVTVHGGDEEAGSYTHRLTVLCFPLAKLFANPSHWPEPMQGHIEVRQGREDEADAGSGTEQTTDAADDDGALPSLADAGNKDNTRQAAPEPHPAKPAKTEAKAVKPAIKSPAFNKPAKAVAVHKPGNKPAPAGDKPGMKAGADAAPQVVDEADAAWFLDARSSALADDVDVDALPQACRKTPKPPEAAKPAAGPSCNTHDEPGAGSAKPEPQPPAVVIQPLPKLAPLKLTPQRPQTLPAVPSLVLGRPAPAAHAKSAPAAMEDDDGSLPPVLLKPPKLPRVPGAESGQAPDPGELATGFMRWLQQSLVEREIKYNETGAAVHFVAEGMALVSPLIFRLYAASLGGDESELAKKVQREVIKAGWHMPGPNKKNILRYAVVRGQTVVSHLSVVVLVQPGRWVQPVPPINPVLRLD